MDLSMSRSKVKRAIDDLERHGFIKVEQRYRQSGAKSSLLFTVKDFENTDNSAYLVNRGWVHSEPSRLTKSS